MKLMIRVLLLTLSHFIFSACESKTETPGGKNDPALRPGPVQSPIIMHADSGQVWNVFGLKIVGKVFSKETAGEYAVIVSHSQPQGGPPPHVHRNEDELFYVLEGTFEFTSGGRRQVGGPGTLAILPRGIPHSFKNVGDVTGVLMNTIMPGGFEDFFAEVATLATEAQQDRALISQIARRYGVEFLQVVD